MTSIYWVLSLLMLFSGMALAMIFFRVHRILEPNVVMVMLLCHLLMQMAAATVLLSSPTAEVAPTYFMACALSVLLIPLGGVVGNFLVPARRQTVAIFRRASISHDLLVRRATLRFFLTLLVFSSVLFAIYISRTGPAPVRELIAGASLADEVRLARLEASHGDIGIVFGMAQRFFMPLMFLMAVMGIGYFRTLTAKLACVVAIGIALLYNGWAGGKTPVAMLFFLGFLVVLLRKDEIGKTWLSPGLGRRAAKWWKRRRRRSYLVGGLFAAMAIGYAVFIYLLKPAGSYGIGYVLEHIFLRLAFKPAMNTYYGFEAFTLAFDYTGFSDVRRLAGLFGWGYVDLSETIAVYKGLPSFASAPPAAIGNFYAQGGWLVLVLGVLVASAVFKIVENLIHRTRRKSVVHVALYALLLYGAFRFSWANFHTILMTECLLPLLLVLVIWNLVGHGVVGSQQERHAAPEIKIVQYAPHEGPRRS